MPYIGRSTDGFGVRNRFLYLASANDTSVSGADASGATLTFTDGAYVDVYLNGVLLKAGTDYNTNTANTIASLAAMAANDEVTVVVYDIFTTADMVSATSGGTFVGAVTLTGGITGDLDLNTDSAVIKFGADDDVTITHDPDDGLILKSTATGDDNPFLLTLQTGETDLAANDVIGKIAFQAPDEGTGTDAILVSGAIQAVAEGDHSASSNATSLQFMTGASEAASTKMTLTSAGNVGIGTTSPNIISSNDTHLDVRSGGTYAFFELGKTATITSGDIAYMEFLNGNNNRMASIAGGADGANNDGYMRFSTLLGGTYTEAMRIDHDGDVKIVKGDIFFGASGKGINLGVTSNTNSNTLDDYEEGSASVDVEDGSGNEMSFYEQDGQYNALYYTKIGNTVFFTVRLYSNGTSGMTGSDALRITNLPFTAANRASGRFTITNSSDFALTNALSVGGFINDNSTIAYFRKQDTDGTGSYLTVTESNAPRCDLAGWYHTA